MKPPLFVRSLTDEERIALRAALRSPEAFTLRRAQILLRSADGHRPKAIAEAVGCCVQSVRNTLRAFAAEGLDCLQEKPSTPLLIHWTLDELGRRRLRDLLHQSPRDFAKTTSFWTLELAAEIAFAQGITPRRVAGETIRQALKRLGVSWKRAKTWITSPDPAYLRKKNARDRLIRLMETHPNWTLGFQDEVWWSRLARPEMHVWAAGEPMRLHEVDCGKDDADPKALACYGILRADTGQMMIRFVEGRPVSGVTEEFLGWVCQQLAAEGKKALLLVWDNASWHVSGRVRSWIKAHNRRVKAEGGVRIVACWLPVKAPWLNRIEAKWVHGKRAIIEPERKLTGEEVVDRVCEYYGCEKLDRIEQQVS